MTTMEILLLVGGLAAFIISFFLPDGSSGEAGGSISREEVERLFDDEVELSRQKIDDFTKETLDYSMEKTERSLEKIANEKILAVGEYSDTVLDQINQSHNQVVFLSDMLHKSKEELTELLNRADQASKDANIRANEAYDLASNAKKLAEDAAERAEEAGRTAVSAEEKMIDARRLMQEQAIKTGKTEEALDEPAMEEVEMISEPREIRSSGRLNAEERLVENLSQFMDGRKETEPVSDTSWTEDFLSTENAVVENEETAETITETAENSEGVSSSWQDLFAGEERAADWDRGQTAPDFGSETDLFNGESNAEAASEEDPYAGLSEEEKMEALLRAATEELAQDVASVTGISETQWFSEAPSEEETLRPEEAMNSLEPESFAEPITEEKLFAEEKRPEPLDESGWEESAVSGEEVFRPEEAMSPQEPDSHTESETVTQESFRMPEDPEAVRSGENALSEESDPEEEKTENRVDEEAETSSEEKTVKAERAKTPAKKPSAKKTGRTGSGRKKTSPAGDGQMSFPAELLEQQPVSLQFAPGEETSKNNNDRILEMHRMGRSDMAIARELGMGIGEVKLVIALDEIS